MGSETGHLYLSPPDASLYAANFTMTRCENQGTLRVLNPNLLLEEMGPFIAGTLGAKLSLEASEEAEWIVHWYPASDVAPVAIYS